MHWGKPYFLILLVLIPLLFVMIGIANRKRKAHFKKFAEPRFYNFFMSQLSVFHYSLKNSLFIFALFFMIIALAQPRWGKELHKVKKEGIDIVVCLDVSKSMDAEDIKPSRIERAKDQISLFIENLRGDRIAIVPFAGKSYVQCPLTDDYGAAKMFLSLLDTNSIQEQGTNIGDAIKTSMKLFREKAKHKIIILVSDGEDLTQDALETAKATAKEGAIIYSLGIGTPEGSTIPMTDENGNTVHAKDSNGNIILTKLDVATLSKIANISEGKFYPITPRQSEIYAILKSINSMEKSKYASKEFLRYKEQYKYFAFMALLLLFIENLIIYTKKSKMKRVIEESAK